MKRLKIGIPGWKTGENSFGAGTNHLTYIQQFGDACIIMPHDHTTDYDILYLPGGMDMNPAAYGQFPGFHTSNQDVHKQYFYDKKLQAFIDKGIPIFGVCLGFQMLLAKFGCKMSQDLPYHPQSSDRWQEGHKVQLKVAECLVYGVYQGFSKKAELKVNSHHHQGCLIDGFSEEHLTALAVSEDGVVEAVAHKTLPIFGVQWHPEEWYDNFTTEVMQKLVKYAQSKV